MRKVIEGFPDYEVDEQGNVWSNKSNKFMKPQLLPNGYYYVHLRDAQGIKTICYIHRLVATTYLPNERLLPEVNHKDSDKAHNHKSNLEWCSSLYNMRHMVEAGHHPQAISIRLIHECGRVVNAKSIKHAARLSGISPSSVDNLKAGKRSSVNGWSLV